MSIEVRQLIIKSSVLQRSESNGEGGDDESKKQAILEECKKLIQKTLQELKER